MSNGACCFFLLWAHSCLCLVSEQFSKTNPPLPSFMWRGDGDGGGYVPSSSFEIGRKITSIMFVWWSIIAKRPFALNTVSSSQSALAPWMSSAKQRACLFPTALGEKRFRDSVEKETKYWMGNFYRWKYGSKHMITHTLTHPKKIAWMWEKIDALVDAQLGVLFHTEQSQHRIISKRWMLLLATINIASVKHNVCSVRRCFEFIWCVPFSCLPPCTLAIHNVPVPLPLPTALRPIRSSLWKLGITY